MDPALSEIRALMKDKKWASAYRKARETRGASDLAWECVVNGSTIVGGTDNREGRIALLRIPSGNAVDLCDAFGPLKGRHPALSPDGMLLAFTQPQYGGDKIAVIRSDGSGPITVLRADQSNFDRGPAWSSDGKRIAFSCSSGRDDDYLCSIDADGANFKKHPIGENPARSPSWSPDGKSLACVSLNGRRWSPSVVDPARYKCVVIADPGGFCGCTQWSPDGLWIAFIGFAEKKWGAFIVKPDGTDMKCLTPPGSNITAVAWSPHGSRLLAFGTIDAVAGLHALSPEGAPPLLLMKCADRSLTSLSCGPPADDVESKPVAPPPPPPTPTAAEQRVIDQARALMKSKKWKSAYELIKAIPAAGPDADRCVAEGSTIYYQGRGWTNGDGDGFVANPAGGTLPSWSPDGRRIAYFKSEKLNKECVFVQSIPSGTPKPLNAEFRINPNYPPAWSPDGSRLAVTILDDKADPFGHRIVLLDAETGKAAPLLKGADFGGDPSWSPDGKRIAFVSQRSYAAPESRLCVMRADGGDVRTITGEGVDLQPRWSPNGKRIAFLSKREGPRGTGGYLNLFAVDPDGGNERALARGEYVMDQPLWSPDGRWVMFLADRRDTLGANLWVVPAEGGEIKPVTLTRANHDRASWGPDSRRIAFVRHDDVGLYLPYIMEIGAREARPVILDRKWHGYSSWSPLRDE